MNINHLEGDKSNCFNVLYTFFFWAMVYCAFTDEKRKIDTTNLNTVIHDSSFHIILAMYIVYLLMQFFTTGFRKFIQVQDISKILKVNIENKFRIIFKGKAWHEENRNGHNEDVTTFTKKIKYEFKCGADYSKVIIDSNYAEGKKYLDLEIEIEYICADDITKSNHDTAFSEFEDLVRRKDTYHSVKKVIEIPKAHSKNIISLTSCCSMTFDRILFIIAIFLTLGQPFKYYISRQICKRNIKITKVISNYYDLTEADYFFNIQPNVKLNGENLQYNRKSFTFKNEEGLEVALNNTNLLTSELKSFDSEMITLNDNVQKYDNKDVNMVTPTPLYEDSGIEMGKLLN